MSSYHPVVWRMARRIHEQLRARRRSHAELYLPHASWAKAQQLVRQIDMARRRGWDRATKVLRERLVWQLERLQSETDRIAEEVNRQSKYSPIPSLQELANDLDALASEFDGWECRPGAAKLSVTTESIVLNAIDLGRFQIELDVKALASKQYYRVIALEPNPASENQSVTHPHVQNERLCEGEGQVAIQDALAEGRLFDFFLIVSRLLSSYGEGSAYIELKDWHGLPCRSCGCGTGDEGCYCQRCDDRLCDDCSCWCSRCDSSYCDHCIGTCHQCEEPFCSGCLDVCCTCQQSTCANCLEEGHCDACRNPTAECTETADPQSAVLGTPSGSACEP